MNIIKLTEISQKNFAEQYLSIIDDYLKKKGLDIKYVANVEITYEVIDGYYTATGFKLK